LKIKPSHEGRTDVLIWICLYGGLLSIAAAFAVEDVPGDLAWWLGSVGSLATVLGIVLIYIRSRKN
jgi:predicted NAD-dependent protein-ADP-ribosyltransferase YbiA (DUF1768 family)